MKHLFTKGQRLKLVNNGRIDNGGFTSVGLSAPEGSEAEVVEHADGGFDLVSVTWLNGVDEFQMNGLYKAERFAPADEAAK